MRAARSPCVSLVKEWLCASEFRFMIAGINKTSFKHKHYATVASRGHGSKCSALYFLGQLKLSEPCSFKDATETALCNSLSVCKVRIFVLSDYHRA
jgi:hypothetical protein